MSLIAILIIAFSPAYGDLDAEKKIATCFAKTSYHMLAEQFERSVNDGWKVKHGTDQPIEVVPLPPNAIERALHGRDGWGVYGERIKVGVATYEATPDGKTLRFDIDLTDQRIESPLEGLGAYPLLLAKTLEVNPQTREIPMSAAYDDSANTRIFVHSLLNDTQSSSPQPALLKRAQDLLSESNLKTAQANELIALRNNVISSLKNTPAYKARSKCGFENIEAVILDPAVRSGKELELGFNITKGPQDEEGLRIYIKTDTGYVQLDSQGNLTLSGQPHELDNYRSLIGKPRRERR